MIRRYGISRDNSGDSIKAISITRETKCYYWDRDNIRRYKNHYIGSFLYIGTYEEAKAEWVKSLTKQIKFLAGLLLALPEYKEEEDVYEWNLEEGEDYA